MGNHRAERGSRAKARVATRVAPAVTTSQGSQGSQGSGSRSNSQGGKRRAAAPARRTLPSLPSAPLVAGVAVLAVSVGGAVTAGNSGLVSDINKAAAQTSSAAVSDALSRREQVVSRDARRDQAAAEKDQFLATEAAARVALRQETLDKIRAKAAERAAVIKKNLWQLPMTSYAITATFGQYGLWANYHTGLDFNGDTGDNIYAVANGTITFTGYDGAYGNKTILTLDDGTEIWFCHQNEIYVSVGETVHAGDHIGDVGATGHVTGSHLHLEVRPGGGSPIDPFTAFADHGIVP